MRKRPALRIPVSRKLLYTAVVLGVLLGLAEGVVRRDNHRSAQVPAIVQYHPDPALQYVLTPGATGSSDMMLDMPDASVVISSQGLRDRERAIPRPPDTVRMVVIGDSFTFGWGVDLQDVYISWLERLLDAATPHTVEVVNMGVPGYNLVQEVALLEASGLAFEPQVVMVGYVSNDLDGPEPQFGPREGAPLLYRSHLFSWLMLYVRPGYRTRKTVDANLDALRHLAQLAQEGGFTVLFAGVGDAGYGWERDTAVQLARELGLPRLPPPRDFPQADEIIAADGHWNEAGHRRLAQHLSSAIQQRGLLPLPAPVSELR